MNKFEFLKEWYYKEDDRKDCLNNSLNIPIGILTAVLAGIYFFSNKYNYSQESNLLKYSFSIFATITIVFWLICIYYLLKSYNDFYTGYSYKAFPSANFLNKEEEDLNLYLETYKDDLDPNITIDILIQQNVEKTLIECIDVNVYNNDRKSAYLHKSKIHLLNSILALFILSVLFTINYINHEKEEIYKIQIIKNEIMRDDQRRPPPPPPPRQEPRTIKEDKQPTRQTPPPPPRPRDH
jgi:hypothetical protein